MTDKLKELYVRLLKMKPILPGSISEQYNICGKANCRCKDKVNPRKHGPQLKLGFSLNGRNSTLVVKKGDRKVAMQMNENFVNLRRLQPEINGEILRVYKEVGAKDTHKLVDDAWVYARKKVASFQPTNSSPKKLEESRKTWKTKAKERNAQLKKESIRIRDLTASRDKWKEKTVLLKAVNEDYKQKLASMKVAELECDELIEDLKSQLKKLRP